MRKILCVILSFVFTLHLFSNVEIFLNDAKLKDISSEWFTENSSYIPFRLTNEKLKGIPIGDLIPVMYSVEFLGFSNDEKKVCINGENVESKLYRIFLVRKKNAWIIVRDGKVLLENLKRIDVKGDVLENGKLTVWVDWEGIDNLKRIIQRYDKLHDNVKINVVYVPRTYGKLLTVQRARGKVPDIVMVQADYIHRLVHFNAIQNVDYLCKYIPTIKKAYDAFLYKGKIWAVPFYSDVQMVFYNRDMFDKYNIPYPHENWTLNDMVNIAKKFKENGVVGLAWNAYSAYWFIPFQIGFGKDKIIEDGRINVYDEPSIRALEYIYNLKKRKIIEVLEREAMMSKFIYKKAVMILSASFIIPRLKKLNMNFGVIHYPYNEETKKYISPLIDFKGFAITKRSKNTIFAIRLIEYLLNPLVQYEFCHSVHKIPVEKYAFEFLKNADSVYDQAYKSMNIGTLIPTDPAYKIYKSAMWNVLNLVFNGKLSPKMALFKIQKIVDEKLNEGGCK